MARFPRAQRRLVTFERFLIKIEHARIAAALTAIFRQGALGRARPRVVVVIGHRLRKGVDDPLCIGFARRTRAARLWRRIAPRAMRYCARGTCPPVITSTGPRTHAMNQIVSLAISGALASALLAGCAVPPDTPRRLRRAPRRRARTPPKSAVRRTAFRTSAPPTSAASASDSATRRRKTTSARSPMASSRIAASARPGSARTPARRRRRRSVSRATSTPISSFSSLAIRPPSSVTARRSRPICAV